MKSSLFKGLNRKVPRGVDGSKLAKARSVAGFAYVGIFYLRVPVHQNPRFHGHYY